MTKKRPSAASAKRLRAEHLQAAQQPVEVPEPIRVYLDQYRAAGIEDRVGRLDRAATIAALCEQCGDLQPVQS